MTEAIIHGWILALGLILPLGVQNVFVFNQGALQPRWIRSLPAVLTASLCDTLLITLAVAGISIVVLNVAWVKWSLFTAGFFFLLYMGWNIWRSSPDPGSDTGTGPLPPARQVGFALSVSLLNPHAILDTIGVIGTSSLQYDGAERIAFTLTCVAVSWIWFFGLSIAGALIRSLDGGGIWLRRVNRLSALIIWGVAVWIGRELVIEIISS
ncbi:LysE/ArgO family amino acid transporter [Staphylospora marina]|uniref:LysE/ArgO family amino acid transporter n=1 Tax=Staphylospora marina TaxID=2490858 RepID=UPI000F5BEB17|nr:LysE/ArgO family amino acid transporter [Staphylospora marina]